MLLMLTCAWDRHRLSTGSVIARHTSTHFWPRLGDWVRWTREAGSIRGLVVVGIAVTWCWSWLRAVGVGWTRSAWCVTRSGKWASCTSCIIYGQRLKTFDDQYRCCTKIVVWCVIKGWVQCYFIITFCQMDTACPVTYELL